MKLHLIFLSFFTAILFIFSTGCKKTSQDIQYLEAAKRSLVEGVDLVLVGEPYSIIDEKWLAKTKTTTYNLDALKKQVKRYGKNWEDFKKEYADRIRIEGNTVYVETEGTSHFTNYEYDSSIPILFYGSKFIQPGIYQDIIFQQHIVPTIAKIIGSPTPNGAKLNPLPIIQEKTQYRPEAILTIVIDQGGLELYNAHPNSYPNIKRLMNESAYFPNAQVGHLDAHTGVGHVAIGTGAFPREHGVIANSRTYIESDGTKINIIEKKLFETEKAIRKGSYVDPTELKTHSLADVWDAFRENKPVIISQCYAVRASVGMAGHGAAFQSDYQNINSKPDKDIVYWVNKDTMSWETNPEFYQVPGTVSSYKLRDYNLKYNDKPWWKPDEKLDTSFFSKKFYNTVATPTQARLEGELFRETVRKELIEKGLSQDGETDLLYLTLKATDAVGHAHGWESEEARLVLEETDRQVGLILDMMKEEWGDKFVLVLTADHGAAPLREFSKGLYLKHEDFVATVQSLLPESVRGKESLIRFYTSGMVSLNHEVMEKYGISEYSIVKIIEDIRVDGRRFYKKVYRRKDLE
ncbi:MAG: alkaline phosphatase family protein [Leptospira sp.]|nr:alkaline phosphatase family protein [Leptospira sp.]